MTTEPCPDENLLALFMESGLPPVRAAEIDAHLDRCESCRALMVGLARGRSLLPEGPPSDLGRTTPSASGAELPPGATLGRNIVLGRIGAGGMGTVYSAYDPQLDRKVAIKVLRVAAEGEARAMARLAHPHVVHLYDVGAVEGRVYLTMEFVEGPTLAEWLVQSPRRPREVLRVFEEAGRGLAAAHGAGLVHGDFKPENVLIGRDGRARVTDFGLASLAGKAQAGVVQGTPAYMSPEQRAGQSVDARSDQYSFAVALSEALTGRRPAEGAPASVRVGRALKRALAEKPEERFRSMEELLAALRPRRTLLGWPAVAAMLGVLVLGLGTWTWRRARVCQGAEAQLQGIWDAPTQAAIHAAFSETKRPFAEDAWNRVKDVLDGYSAAWVKSHVDACEATRVRKDQSEETLTRRMACLSRRREGLRALSSAFGKADGQTVEQSVNAAARLPRVEDCADLAALSAPIRPPAPEQLAAVQDDRASIANAHVLADLGKLKPASETASAALTQARAVGYPPLIAEALVCASAISTQSHDGKRAEELATEAVWIAEAERDDHTAAEAAIEMATAVGGIGDRAEDGEHWIHHAKNALQRLGGNDALEVRRMTAESLVLSSAGKLDESDELTLQALQLAEKTFGSQSIQLARPLVLATISLGQHGKPKKALPLIERAVALLEAELGPKHPKVSAALALRGMVYQGLGRYPEAKADLHHALEIDTAVFGPDCRICATTHQNLGTLLQDTGDLPGALEEYAHARDLSERNEGPQSLSYARALSGVAGVEMLQGRQVKGLAEMERVLAIEQKALGPNHPEVAKTLANIAAGEQGQSQPKKALEHLVTAEQVLDRTLGKEHPTKVVLLNLRGRCLSDLHRFPEAWHALEAAKQLGERVLPPSEQAHTFEAEAYVFDAQHKAKQATEARRKADALRHKTPDP